MEATIDTSTKQLSKTLKVARILVNLQAALKSLQRSHFRGVPKVL